MLPTKTHTSLDVTGTSLGTHRGTQRDDTTQGNYGIYKKLHSLGRVSFNFFSFFFLPAYCKQAHPEGLWKVRIRGSFTRNLSVLPVFKLGAKPNKSFECLPKKTKRTKTRNNDKNVHVCLQMMNVYIGRILKMCFTKMTAQQ